MKRLGKKFKFLGLPNISSTDCYKLLAGSGDPDLYAAVNEPAFTH